MGGPLARDWNDFERLIEYLRDVSDDPKVAALLSTKFYPRWAYGFRDRVLNLRRKMRTSLRGAIALPADH